MFQAIDSLLQEAEESEQERAQRIEQTAEAYGMDPVTLLDVEEQMHDVGEAVQQRYDETLDEARANVQADPEAAAYAPFLDFLGADTVTSLVTKLIVSKPRLGAWVVRELHRIFERTGFYEEVDLEADREG